MIIDDSGEVRFFPKDIESRVFLSERDCIVPTKLILEFLNGDSEDLGSGIRVMTELDHGGFLFQADWMDIVLRTVIGMEPKRTMDTKVNEKSA
jgi:hypothetical protein